MYDTPLTLERPVYGKNSNGDMTNTATVRKNVMCEVKSVRQSEFYQSAAAGFKPELMVQIADYRDYQGEKTAVVDGVRYKILRTYKKNTVLEIVLYGGVIIADA